MLFHVHMKVIVPHDVDKQAFDAIKATEKAYSQKLQREGKWRHLWRIAGLYENISIFDVINAQELNDILMGLPLYPYMEIKVQALCIHPSSVREGDK